MRTWLWGAFRAYPSLHLCPTVLVLVLSEAVLVLVLVLETIVRVAAIVDPEPACHSGATPTIPSHSLLELSSESFAGHWFAIQSQRDSACLPVATRRPVTASDANPRSRR